MRRAEQSGHGLQVAITGVTAAALIAWAAHAFLLPANADTLRVRLGSIRTSVAEGLTLARADDERRALGHFYGTELDLLRGDAAKTASSLATDRTLVPLRPRFAEAAALAREAARKLHDLAIPGTPAESVVAAQATLVAIQLRVNQMEQELEP